MIDDTKDADATNTHGNDAQNASTETLEWLNETNPKFKAIKQALSSGKVGISDVRKKFKVSKKVEQLLIK